jgi:hypothetical protein
MIRRGNAFNSMRTRMRGILLTALAAATILSSGMPLAAPAALGAAIAGTGLVQRATNVCGSNGCVRVQTTRLRKHQLPPPHH